MERKIKSTFAIPGDLGFYKDFAIKAADELFYSDGVINAIKNAKSHVEITRILKTARERSFED